MSGMFKVVLPAEKLCIKSAAKKERLV